MQDASRRGAATLVAGSDVRGAPPARHRREVRRPRHLAVPAMLIASVLLMEAVLRSRLDLPFVNDGLLYTALFAGAVSLLVHLVSSVFRGPARTIVVGLYLASMTALFMSQLIYQDIFGTFYTVYSASNAGQVLEFADAIGARIRDNAVWLLLLAAPMVLFFAPWRRGWSRHRFGWIERGVTAGLTVALIAGALVGINLGDTGRNSANEMYYRQSHPVVSVNRLGLVTTMRLDLQRTLLGGEPEVPPPVAALPEPEATPGDPSEAPSGPSPEGGTPVAEPVFEENVLDIDFSGLAAETSDETLSAMHRYFGTREASQQNEHTGMFEGYNLVFITAEGFSHLAVDEEVTPTLHTMIHEGFHFSNFYTPIWGVSTSDGEYVATTGLIPKSGVWSMYKSGANSMPFAMGNQLGRLGYTTLAYHNHTYDYYERDISHPNLGYEYKGLGNGLQVTRTWPESDIEMIDVTTAEFVGNEPFHAYYMTVSGHLEYNFGGNFIAKKNRDLVQGLPYTDAGKAYIATQIELDRALELLMSRLEEAGVADRTLIVLSSDHYPYGLEKGQIDDLAGHEVEANFELYRNGLIMYAKGMEPQVVDRPVSSLDIIPTVSNLMGLEFDSRLLMGVDAFSEKDPLVIFSNRSFITDKGRYNSLTGEFLPAEGVDVPEDYQRRISDEIDRQFAYSALILDTDYYGLVVDR